MAKTLADALRGAAAGVAAPQAGQTQRTAELLKAKSGKAVTGRGPGMSSLAEQAGVTAAKAALQRGQETAEVQAQQIEQQEVDTTRRERVQQADIGQARDAFRSDMQSKENAVLGELDRAGRELDFQKDRSKLEQLGFLAALQDEEYMHGLKIAGERGRLTNDISFREALHADVFEGMEDLFAQEVELREKMDAKDREFGEYMATIDVEQAMSILNSDMRAANTQAVASGAGNIVSAGASGYATHGNPFEKKKKDKNG